MMGAVRAHEHRRLATKRKKRMDDARNIYKGRKEGEQGQDIHYGAYLSTEALTCG
jgi:hypothetical protein